MYQLSYKDTIRETSIGVSDDKVVTTSSETICDYKAYCRDICYKVISHNGFDQIGGPGLEVEIDESNLEIESTTGVGLLMVHGYLVAYVIKLENFFSLQ